MKQRLPLLFAILCISSALMWGAFSCLSIEQKGGSQEEVVSQIAPLAESAIVMDMRTTRVLFRSRKKENAPSLYYKDTDLHHLFRILPIG